MVPIEPHRPLDRDLSADPLHRGDDLNTHFIGIDPGFEGGIAIVNAAGTTAKAWLMPITHGERREYDLDRLHAIFKGLHILPDPLITMEWPTTRPGEGAERCERFGRGKGYLEAFAYLMGFKYEKVSPNTWKGRLGLPGKFDDPGSEQGVAWFLERYPAHEALIRGPRGGLLDGPLDALLIAEYARMGAASPFGWKGGKRPQIFRGLPQGSL